MATRARTVGAHFGKLVPWIALWFVLYGVLAVVFLFLTLFGIKVIEVA